MPLDFFAHFVVHSHDKRQSPLRSNESRGSLHKALANRAEGLKGPERATFFGGTKLALAGLHL
jgi:hypothetical protein